MLSDECQHPSKQAFKFVKGVAEDGPGEEGQHVPQVNDCDQSSELPDLPRLFMSLLPNISFLSSVFKTTVYGPIFKSLLMLTSFRLLINLISKNSVPSTGQLKANV